MSYVPKYELTERIKSNLAEIEKIKDKVRGSRILPQAEASIRLRASVEAVHSSTSIEGNPLSANEVRAVISSDRILSRKEYAEIEVQNYKRALEYIEKRKHGRPEITVGDILELHKIITERLLMKSKCGAFRKNPVYIENQNREVVYTAVEPELVEAAVNELVDWIQASEYIVHPAIIAGIIHFRMVAIHPFADGNGRTARALTSLYLALHQYDCDGALVLDSYYAAERDKYYAVLALVNGKNYTSSEKADLTPWLEYFTDGFVSSLHVLDAEIRILGTALGTLGGGGLSREDQDLLSYVTKFGSINISEAEYILPELSRRSIQRKLKALVDAGYLELVGETREVRYVAKG